MPLRFQGEMNFHSLLDVAEYFAYDQYQPDFDAADAASVFNAVRHRYLHSDCGDFAAALHRISGWVCGNVATEKGFSLHAVCITPQLQLVDFGGFVSLMELEERYGVAPLTIVPVKVEDLIGCTIGSDESIAFEPPTGVDIASFVITQLDYVPFKDLIQ